MKPENVNPQNFELIKIIFDNDEFSIAYGIFEKGDKCLGMRWNGNITDNDDKGYPKVFKNPMWFIIHNDLKKPFLKSLLGIKNKKVTELIEIINSEFK
ncbi:MAG: hypothetical protein CVT96_04850 [Bacteroidetes bacterium HGW-Bacteroidetes-13]|jgi:hypothetical protein|nr:MAG: hypothetical protein CVT96_04850 [Bacteroidetes bacterium HGW-Bacteroidetes-13]